MNLQNNMGILAAFMPLFSRHDGDWHLLLTPTKEIISIYFR